MRCLAQREGAIAGWLPCGGSPAERSSPQQHLHISVPLGAWAALGSTEPLRQPDLAPGETRVFGPEEIRAAQQAAFATAPDLASCEVPLTVTSVGILERHLSGVLGNGRVNFGTGERFVLEK